MLNEQQKSLHADYSKSMVKGALNGKTGYLVRMAAAIAFSCSP